MLKSMRKLLAITTFFATVALLLAAIALAATPKTSEAFAGNTLHKHYRLSLITGCTAKKCSTGTTVTMSLRAGSPTKAIAGCPYGGYGLPVGKIKQGKFSVNTEFVIAKKLLKFTVSGTFTAANRLKGTVTGVKACGGSDSFSLDGIHVDQIGVTGATGG
jgi:hypothetical protein